MASFMKNIGIIYRCGVKYRNEKLNPYGINGCTNMYIINIVNHPGISQDELKNILCVNKSNVTRALQQLEQEGYIERKVSNKDRRELLLYPTTKALEIFPEVKKYLLSWNEYLLADIDKEKEQIFLEVLDQISQKARNYNENLEEEQDD